MSVLGIYGSGGAGRTFYDVASLTNEWEEIVYIDDTVEEGLYRGVLRMPYAVFKQRYPKENSKVIIAMGEPFYKKQIYEKVKTDGYSLGNIIHPSAYVSNRAVIGEGVFLHCGVCIGPDAVISDNVTFEQYATAAHDTKVGMHSQISAYVMIAGYSEIGSETYIGLHVPVKDKVKIGNHVVVSMGAVVMKDVPDLVTVFGNPARISAKREENELIFK